MSLRECQAQNMHIWVVVTFGYFFFQAASKSMLTRLLEINTLLLECTQMGSPPLSTMLSAGVPRRHIRAPSVMNYIPQINKDWAARQGNSS